MTGSGPSDHPPTMATALPEVTAGIVAVLHQMGHPELAEPLPSQRFYGRCRCKPGCAFALTAWPGSSGTYMTWLQLDGEIIGQASLDPDCRTITDFELDDPDALGIPANWLD